MRSPGLGRLRPLDAPACLFGSPRKLGDVAYLPNAAGWWQAMTVGLPGFPPTLVFFRNSLVSDLLFTGLFAGAMEIVLVDSALAVSFQ